MIRKITKKEFQELCLLIDVLPEGYIYIKGKIDISYTQINLRKEFGFRFPVQYVGLALHSRKRYKRVEIK